jgi:hypothetical protein
VLDSPAIPLVDLAHSLFGLLDPLTLTDQTLVTVLVLVTLLAGVALIALLFFYSRSRASGAVRQLLVEAIEARRFEKRLSDLESLEERLETEEGQLARLQIEHSIEEDPKAKADLAKQIEKGREGVLQLRLQLRAERDRLRAEAHTFAQNVVGEAIPPSLDMSALGRETFFLEFTTVIVIIISVIILALLGVLDGEQLAPILASIAGYVLGRTAREAERHPRP